MVEKMFKEIKLLNKESDKDITISPLANYKHTKNMHFAVVSKDELQEACKTHSIFFIKEQDGAILPIVLLGVKENENLCVNKSGTWDTNKYIPALLRSYPFALAKVKDEQFSLVYDEKYDGLNKKDGKKIFDENSELNEFGKDIVGFVQSVYQGIEATKNITKILDGNDLFKSIDATIEKEGKKFVINGLLQIDTEKLNSLADDKLLEITKKGALNVTYAHLISLSNLNTFVFVFC